MLTSTLFPSFPPGFSYASVGFCGIDRKVGSGLLDTGLIFLWGSVLTACVCRKWANGERKTRLLREKRNNRFGCGSAILYNKRVDRASLYIAVDVLHEQSVCRVYVHWRQCCNRMSVTLKRRKGAVAPFKWADPIHRFLIIGVESIVDRNEQWQSFIASSFPTTGDWRGMIPQYINGKAICK